MALEAADLETISNQMKTLLAEAQTENMRAVHEAIRGAVASEVKPLAVKLTGLEKLAKEKPTEDKKPKEDPKDLTPLVEGKESTDTDKKPTQREIDLEAKLAATEGQVKKMSDAIKGIEKAREEAETKARLTQLKSAALSELAASKKLVPGTEQIFLDTLLARGVIKEVGDKYVAVSTKQNQYTQAIEPVETTISDALSSIFSDNALKIFAAPLPGTGTGGGAPGQPTNTSTNVDLENLSDSELLERTSNPEKRKQLYAGLR
jgi:hypothetical protein